jgi:peptide/nickel transport system ATP-binding protein
VSAGRDGRGGLIGLAAGAGAAGTGPMRLVAEDVSVTFPVRRWPRHDLPAVRSVSLTLARGRVVGVVGESGCGKTTLTRVLAALQQPTSGTVRLGDQDVWALPSRRRRLLVSEHVGLVLQDPTSSMNPRMSVAAIVADPLRVHRRGDRAERRRRVHELLETVRLPTTVAGRRPAELSGGQRQRVAVARALALDPAFLLADEPTSALDVAVRGQLLDLLAELRDRRGLGVLLVSHDMHAARYLADEIAVMYLGRAVEQGPVALLDAPRHPYTAALLSAVPTLAATAPDRIALRGGVPSLLRQPAGCPFHPRCWRATGECSDAYPAASAGGAGPGHTVHCIHPAGTPAADTFPTRAGTSG